MPEDQYHSFEQLQAGEKLGETYRICVRRTESRVAIIAPHGGWIESGTSELAAAIAGAAFNDYAFEGLPPRRMHCELHLASERFNEPQCRGLISECDIVLAIHGRKDKLKAVKRPDPRTILVGGRDEDFRKLIECSLNSAGLRAQVDAVHFPGKHKDNVCNLGKRRRGAQLELSKSLRRELSGNEDRKQVFVDAVHKAIEKHIKLLAAGGQ